MSEPLYRIAYEATLDEAVDVAMRLSMRSTTLRRQFRTYEIITGLIIGAAAAAYCLFYVTGATVIGVALTIAFGGAVAVFSMRLFRRYLFKEIHRQQRKLMTEQLFGGGPTLPCELELRADGAWFRQSGGIEMTFPWRLCTSIADNPGDVELNFAAGVCVVQNRLFSTPAERRRFLDTARRLAADAGAPV